MSNNNTWQSHTYYAGQIKNHITGELSYHGDFDSVKEAKDYFSEWDEPRPLIVRQSVTITPWETV